MVAWRVRRPGLRRLLGLRGLLHRALLRPSRRWAAQDGGAAGRSAAGAAPSPSGSLANCKELTLGDKACCAEATGVTARQASKPPVNRREQSARESSGSETNALCQHTATSSSSDTTGAAATPRRARTPRTRDSFKKSLGFGKSRRVGASLGAGDQVSKGSSLRRRDFSPGGAISAETCPGMRPQFESRAARFSCAVEWEAVANVAADPLRTFHLRALDIRVDETCGTVGQ